MHYNNYADSSLSSIPGRTSSEDGPGIDRLLEHAPPIPQKLETSDNIVIMLSKTTKSQRTLKEVDQGFISCVCGGGRGEPSTSPPV